MSQQERPAVLVTGGAGYIGSHTAKALYKAGFLPITIDNLSRGHADAVAYGHFIDASVGDEAIVKDAIGKWNIECVLHFAAFAYVGESVNDPGLYFRNNVSEMERLLTAATSAGVQKIVFSSSCATYGMPDFTPVTEDTPQRPMSPYGETKLIGERLLRWWETAHGTRHVALRYFNAAGADVDGELGERHDPETHLIPNVVKAALGSGPALQVFGSDYDTPDGTAVRDYIHVNDLASAHVKAVSYLLEGGSSVSLNLGSGVGHSVLSVIREVERISGHQTPYDLKPRRAGDPASLYAAVGRATEVLGWAPKYSDLESICRTAIAWESKATDEARALTQPRSLGV